jgi:hypothetical protein
MAWIVVWAIVTTAVVVLAYYRMTLGLHEIIGVRLGSGHQAEFYGEQIKLERKMDKLDVFGAILTGLSAVMVVVIAILWAIEASAR